MSAAPATQPAAAGPDLIDTLAGIAPGSALDAIRARRPDARHHAQASYEALFGASAGDAVTLAERWALAAFVTALHGSGPVADHYEAGLKAIHSQLAATVLQQARSAATTGPAGRFPEGPLSSESTSASAYSPDPAARTALGPKLSAAFSHAHLLVIRPREASPAALQALLDAGWTTDAVVTLSQIVAFLSFQIRVAAGLAVLAAR